MLTYITTNNEEYNFNALNTTVIQKITGDYTLSFDVLNEPNIIEEMIIRCDNQLFRIKQMDETMFGEQIRKSVNCKHITHDLIDYYEYDSLTNTLTLVKALEFVFKNTPFTFSIVGSVKNQSFENLGNMNKQSLLNKIIEKFGVEYTVDNYHFTFKPKIGVDTEFQFRYKANISDTKKTIDTTSLTTYIKATGKRNENGEPMVSVEYTSPNAKKFGIRHASPISDERFTVEAELIEYAKSKLNDEPSIAVSLKYQDLNAEQHINIGDYGYLIHEPLGLDIKSRIIEIKTYPESTKPNEYTIGSTTFIRSSFETGNNVNNVTGNDNNNGNGGNIDIEFPDYSGDIQNAYEQAVQDATNKINDGLGGYVTKRRDELLIMDNEDVNKAKNLWRWNLGGLGFSSNGYSGPYQTALTSDGKINADRILVGTLHGSLIKANTIQATALDIATAQKIDSSINADDASAIMQTRLEVYDGNIKTHINSVAESKKTEAINSANQNTTTVIANYYTKSETDSQINVAKDAVTTSVSNLQSEVMSATYTNLLENSDFLILDNGFPRGYSSYTLENSEVRISDWIFQGAKAVKISVSGKTAYHWVSLFSPFVKTIEGQQFTASAWVCAEYIPDIDAGCILEIEWYNDTDRISTDSYTFTPKTNFEWERVSVTGGSPTGTTRARVRISVQQNGILYTTKLMLQAGGTATAWTRGGDFETITDRLSYAEQKITDESITNTVKKNFYTKQETENTINNKNFATKSEVQQTADNVTYKFSQSGGYNLIRNGGFENGTNYWSRNGNFTDGKDVWLPYGNGTSWVIWADAWSGFYQFFNCRVGQTYSWSMDVYVEQGYFRAGVEEMSEEWYRADNGWVKMKGTFTATRESHAFILYAAENQTAVHVDNIMVCEGSIPSAYTPHPSEIYDGVTTIDKDGIKVTSSIMNGYTHMTNRGFYINKDDSNIFKVDGDGLSLRGCGPNSGRYIKIENEDYTVWNNNINCLRFGYKNWNGWDGVPEFLMGYKGFRYSETANTGEDASYFGMQTWGRGVKNNNNYAYHDIYYRSDKFGDQSHLRFSEDGLSQLRSLKKIELKAGSDSYIVADKDSGLSFPQGVNTFGINDTIWLKNSNFGITWGKYTGKEEYNLRPTTTAPVDLGHESYRYRTIYATNGSINTSDASLKENINPIVSKAETPILLPDEAKAALSAEDYYEFVKTLPMYTYDYKSKDDEENRALHNVGFIAQDVADTPVGNEFIFKGEDGVYQYNMQGYVGVLAVALQNAIKEIETLKEEIRQLKTTF